MAHADLVHACHALFALSKARAPWHPYPAQLNQARTLSCPAQAMSLARLSVYLDVDRPLFALPRGVPSWTALTPSQWDDLFSPDLHMAAAVQQQQQHEGAAQHGGLGGEGPGPPGAAGSGGSNAGGGFAPLGRVSASLMAVQARAQGGPGLRPLGAMIYEHDFLIAPVSGSLRYTRRWVARGACGLGGARGREGVMMKYRCAGDRAHFPL